MKPKQSPTNDLTQRILKHLYSVGVYAWRQNTLPVPVVRAGVFSGFRPASKSGLPDIFAVLFPLGRLLCIEIKTGKDRLRPEQIGFHANVRKMGGLVLVVKDWDDYVAQMTQLSTEIEMKFF